MKNQYKFKNFCFGVNNTVTPTDISLAVNNFFIKELIDIDSNTKFSILFKIKTPEGY
jgi:hypothetical protein